MPVIKIPFNVSLANVSAPRGHVTTCNAPRETAPAADDFAAERKTLAAFGQQLFEIQRSMQSQAEAVHALVIKAAAAIAGEALGGDDALVEKRVVQFAEVLMRQIQPTQSATAFVHPQCVETLSRWAEEAEADSIEIRPDANLTPGDCRIEVGGKGMVASLESFLTAAAENDVWMRGDGT